MTDNSSQAGPMDVIARNKATARRVFEEVWDNANYDALNELFVQDVQIFHQRMYLTKSISEALPGVKGYHDAIPDLKMNIDQQVAEGNTVVNILTLHGPIQAHPSKMGLRCSSLMGKRSLKNELSFISLTMTGRL